MQRGFIGKPADVMTAVVIGCRFDVGIVIVIVCEFIRVELNVVTVVIAACELAKEDPNVVTPGWLVLANPLVVNSSLEGELSGIESPDDAPKLLEIVLLEESELEGLSLPTDTKADAGAVVVGLLVASGAFLLREVVAATAGIEDGAVAGADEDGAVIGEYEDGGVPGEDGDKVAIAVEAASEVGDPISGPVGLSMITEVGGTELDGTI